MKLNSFTIRFIVTHSNTIELSYCFLNSSFFKASYWEAIYFFYCLFCIHKFASLCFCLFSCYLFFYKTRVFASKTEISKLIPIIIDGSVIIRSTSWTSLVTNKYAWLFFHACLLLYFISVISSDTPSTVAYDTSITWCFE